ACGAVSGFHAMVSSGTTSKQLNRESDALFVGYGSMLFEGGLAVLVLIACTAGIGMGVKGHDGVLLTGSAAFVDHYGSWSAANGLGAKLGAFVEGAANMIASVGLDRAVAVTVMGVFIVSFAATTLDTATRIQRYVVVELAEGAGLEKLAGRWPATLIAVFTAMALAFYSGDGKGAMALWPIFGAVNQLLAGLALLAVISYLVYHQRPIWIALPPMLFMVVITVWAMVANGQRLWAGGNFFLAGLSGLILFLQGWMLLEALLVLRQRLAVSEKL
ncbi:MAG: carbon starvation protein A, partial [Desulfobulbaceae bacterium]|nr:carbon starvation protein A [Desulfobulbaceae bacterium]